MESDNVDKKKNKTRECLENKKLIRHFNEIPELISNCQNKTIVVAAANDEAAIRAVTKIKTSDVADYILVGDKEQIMQISKNSGIDIDEASIIHIKDNIKAAAKAVQMVGSGEADIVMKGYIHTDDFLRAILNKEWGLRSSSIMSHVFIWESDIFDRLIFITDGAMNIAPDLIKKANIIMNAVHLSKMFGIEVPKVAVLAAVEVVNPSMSATTDATNLRIMAERNQYSTSCLIDGPLALDNALSIESAKHKKISGPVAGNADILVVPDIEAGNMLAKSYVYLTGGTMAGVIVGAKAPIVLPSRADTALSKYCSILVAILMSTFERHLKLKIGKIHY